MPLSVALLLSIFLHAALVALPDLLTTRPQPALPRRLDAQLLPSAEPKMMADAVSTESHVLDTMPPRSAIPPPDRLQGRALIRAQSALSRHLFYPPEAVEQGLEGEVILLLILADTGQLISAAIARSSGHAVLDEAALDAARHIGALPGNPRQTLFPVSFRLQ